MCGTFACGKNLRIDAIGLKCPDPGLEAWLFFVCDLAAPLFLLHYSQKREILHNRECFSLRKTEYPTDAERPTTPPERFSFFLFCGEKKTMSRVLSKTNTHKWHCAFETICSLEFDKLILMEYNI